MFLGYYHYAGIGVPPNPEAALKQFDESCKEQAGDACSAAHVLRDDTPTGTIRVLARLLDEERNVFAHRATAVQPHGLPPNRLPVHAMSFMSMSGTVSFSGGRMTAVKGRVVQASPTRMQLVEQRSQNILRIGYTAGSLMLLEWAAPNPSLQDSDCRSTDDCRDSGTCGAEGGYCTTTEAGCREASVCRTRGACGLVNGRCAARDAADCRASSGCRDGGRCRVQDGWCFR